MSKRQRLVLDYWYRLPAPNGLPLRNSFDPLEVWSALASLVLYEIVGAGEDVIFRLVGEAFEERAGTGLRGRRFTEFGSAGRIMPILSIVQAMYNEPRPKLSADSLATLDRGFISYRRLSVPFAEEKGGPARYILCCYDFDS